MTRIVGGPHGGRRLRVPPGSATRPTADRTREALFSSLQSLTELVGARFLDLYAGSGAVGLEALSRGAARATLVESDPRAVAVLRANAAALALPAEVVPLPVERFLAGLPPPGDPLYDVVVLDPPYSVDVDPVLLRLLPWVAAGGVVAVERSARTPPPTWPDGLSPERTRRYGDTALWYGSRS